MQARNEIVFRSGTGYVVQLYSSLGDECTGLDMDAGREGGFAKIRDPLQNIFQYFSLSSHQASIITESRGSDIDYSTGGPKGDTRLPGIEFKVIPGGFQN